MKLILQKVSTLHLLFQISFHLFQRTPLHIAAGKGYTDTTESLVAKEADINIKDNDGVSTFHY